MDRLARIVILDVAHLVTQRGNRLPIFFSDDDRALYLGLLRAGCAAAGVRCLAWCLAKSGDTILIAGKIRAGRRGARRGD